MKDFEIKKSPEILVEFESFDDAAVAKLNEKHALLYTLDIITPVVDDPEIFGEIAAANALSDIYAMGGTPWLCLNILCFPTCKLPQEYMKLIIKGGLKKIEEAGAFLVGGHSVDDVELKYGLSVVGKGEPQKITKNSGAKPGNHIFLTKPIGLGIIITAIKAGMCNPSVEEEAIEIMRSLNKEASQKMIAAKACAATDVTGFGLIGHAVEMAQASGVDIVIESNKVPFIKDAIEYAQMGLIPKGAYENKEYFSKFVEMEIDSVDIEMMLYDPQTSGGLFVALPAESCDFPYPKIGYITEGNGKVIVR